MITENVSTLKIHKLTQAQYDRELEAGRIDGNALYLTPDEDIDLSDYVTNEQLGDKVDALINGIDNLVYVSEENQESAVVPLNADTLGGVPASEFATKDDISDFPTKNEVNDTTVSIDGDTMTGLLIAPAVALKKHGDYSQTLRWYDANDNHQTAINTTSTNRLTFRQYNAETGKNEYYQLPEITEGLSANNGYRILTSKNPVTIAQGGTNAKTIEEAKTNFGLGVELWSGSWNSGDITVPNTDRYKIFAISFDGQGTEAIAIRHGTSIRGIGGYSSATPTVTTFQFAATVNGNTWTFVAGNSVTHATSGSHGAITSRAVNGIIGLL